MDGLPLRNDAVRLFTVERSRQGKTGVHRVEVSEQLLKKAEEGVLTVSAMGHGYLRRCAREHLMKLIYLVTEGPTDQIVIEGLIDH